MLEHYKRDHPVKNPGELFTKEARSK